MSAAGFVSRELVHDGAVLKLEFRHPKGNLLTAEVVSALREALARAPSRVLKLIAIQGAGRDFSFGASVPEHAPGEIDRVLPEFHRLVADLLDASAATAAIVRGRCLGGGFELALACDLIFAAETAQLGLPEISLGVFPPVGSILLPARVGLARGTAAVLRGDSRSAGEWHRAGLIQELAPEASLDGVVDGWFTRYLASKSPSAIRFAARAVRHGVRERLNAALPSIERLYLSDLMATHDAAEGIAAFLEKRPPRWTGE
jgi:cyclohexa-1,5-dienecarbonyl-CoA hydratase